ncbi:coiled-coil domain-containing protein 127-like [Anguilla anguilla]|uniref:coiled-coil domain-containing protein 127-like n=1 Tax=Anguilla anguilla TaxID=7936 RepID=UPI0015AC1288|nr:coiled-coil domain-containing protein 127-like [Anguilla anguilla]
MNNINSTGQNVEPDKKGGGEGNKLTYGFGLVALLGLAFYRWCWQRDTQRQKQEVESNYKEELKIVFKELEKEQREKSKLFLNMVENDLMERQHFYCSHFTSRKRCFEIERKLLDRVAREPLAKGLDMEADLKKIFEKDQHCANWLNKDKSKNGRMMWEYFMSWQRQISQQQHKKATAAPVKQQSDLK